MAELVDAPDSKSSSSNGVRVRFPLRPPENCEITIRYFPLQNPCISGALKFLGLIGNVHSLFC